MTNCLGKGFFSGHCVSFVNVYQCVCVLLSLFFFEGGMWDLTVLFPEHCLSITFFIYTLKFSLELKVVLKFRE